MLRFKLDVKPSQIVYVDEFDPAISGESSNKFLPSGSSQKTSPTSSSEVKKYQEAYIDPKNPSTIMRKLQSSTEQFRAFESRATLSSQASLTSQRTNNKVEYTFSIQSQLYDEEEIQAQKT